MKANTLITFFLIISFSCFGKRIYTLSKDDFIKQFNDSFTSNKIYCFNEKENKVWLVFNHNSTLTIKLVNGKIKELLLNTIRYKDGIVTASVYNTWYPSNKKTFFNINDISSLTIQRKYQEYELTYFNLDSLRSLVMFKNDSLKKMHSSGNQFVIYFETKNKADTDSFPIIENACYNMSFQDKKFVRYGVVQKITVDSIYISNYLSPNMAAANKTEYRIYQYPVNEISGLNLLNFGGYSFKNIKIENYNVIIKKITSNNLSSPCWFAVDSNKGKVDFYRSWLTARGFIGIAEEGKNTIWYEGN